MPATTEKTIELADLLKRRVRTVEIDINDGSGETFWVKYKPDALTKDAYAEIQAAEGADTAAALLMSFLSGWSLTVGGDPYAITAENLEALGFPLQMAISAVVWKDFNDNALGKSMLLESPKASNGT